MTATIASIAASMEAAGHAVPFISRVLELARESEGIEDLLFLWAEAPNDERRELVEAMQEAIADRLPGRRLQSGELAAWVVGGVSPDRAEEIAAAVSMSPNLQRRVATLRRRNVSDDSFCGG